MIEPAAEHLGKVVKRSLPKGWHFALILTDGRPDGDHAILSSITTEDTIRFLRVKADFLEKQQQPRSPIVIPK